MKQQYKLPVTIITGCLGSGKTTVLRHLLTQPTFKNAAVIVNEFGKVGLDHHLLRQTNEKTILLQGGCICCNHREDLEQELKSLLSLEHKCNDAFQQVVIETTGMADPAPILFTILSNPLLQHHFYIQCIVTTVDAKNGVLHMKNNPELVKQVTVADKVVLTKTDLASKKQKEQVVQLIHSINPTVRIIEAIYGVIDDSLVEEQPNASSRLSLKNHSISACENHYSANISSISFTFRDSLDWTAFGLWLSALLHANGENIMRVKGLLNVGEPGPIVLNGVQHIIHPPDHLNTWPEEMNKVSHLIFILRSIDPESILVSLSSFQRFLGVRMDLLEISHSD